MKKPVLYSDHWNPLVLRVYQFKTRFVLSEDCVANYIPGKSCSFVLQQDGVVTIILKRKGRKKIEVQVSRSRRYSGDDSSLDITERLTSVIEYEFDSIDRILGEEGENDGNNKNTR